MWRPLPRALTAAGIVSRPERRCPPRWRKRKSVYWTRYAEHYDKYVCPACGLTLAAWASLQKTFRGERYTASSAFLTPSAPDAGTPPAGSSAQGDVCHAAARWWLALRAAV